MFDIWFGLACLNLFAGLFSLRPIENTVIGVELRKASTCALKLNYAHCHLVVCVYLQDLLGDVRLSLHLVQQFALWGVGPSTHCHDIQSTFSLRVCVCCHRADLAMPWPNLLDPERAEFLPLCSLATAREAAYLEARGAEHVELRPQCVEHIDVVRAGRFLALGSCKDMGRVAVHVELSRIAGGARQIVYGKAVPLVAAAPAHLFGVPRRPMDPRIDGLGRLYALVSSLQRLGLEIAFPNKFVDPLCVGQGGIIPFR